MKTAIVLCGSPGTGKSFIASRLGVPEFVSPVSQELPEGLSVVSFNKPSPIIGTADKIVHIDLTDGPLYTIKRLGEEAQMLNGYVACGGFYSVPTDGNHERTLEFVKAILKENDIEIA